MYNQKKIRTFTLIEVLISSALFIIIITAIFFWIRVSYNAEMAVERSLKQVQEIQSCKLFLERMFETFQMPVKAQKNSDLFFSTSTSTNPILYFSTTNGVDPDPQLSNDVFVGIGKDTKHRLILTMWASPTNEKFDDIEPRTVILLENISNISWKFLAPAGKVLEMGSTNIEPGSWVDHWPNEIKKQPLAVKLTLEFAPVSISPLTTCQLSFPLPAASQPIPVGK